jgi:hypothetical protein
MDSPKTGVAAFMEMRRGRYTHREAAVEMISNRLWSLASVSEKAKSSQLSSALIRTAAGATEGACPEGKGI